MSIKDDKKLFERIRDEVVENSKLLNNCEQHDFSIDMIPGKYFSKIWKCSNCGGTVSTSHKHWYEKGLKHGRKN